MLELSRTTTDRNTLNNIQHRPKPFNLTTQFAISLFTSSNLNPFKPTFENGQGREEADRGEEGGREGSGVEEDSEGGRSIGASNLVFLKNEVLSWVDAALKEIADLVSLAPLRLSPIVVQKMLSVFTKESASPESAGPTHTHQGMILEQNKTLMDAVASELVEQKSLTKQEFFRLVELHGSLKPLPPSILDIRVAKCREFQNLIDSGKETTLRSHAAHA
ncbi:ATP-dependent zinc metalloprotease FtsH [Spatholobus suberectus]|nr:ATP-dependent zinc metalloprotease FtsH [Spatholobus suberectus]